MDAFHGKDLVLAFCRCLRPPMPDGPQAVRIPYGALVPFVAERKIGRLSFAPRGVLPKGIAPALNTQSGAHARASLPWRRSGRVAKPANIRGGRHRP